MKKTESKTEKVATPETSPNITYKLKRKSETDEWLVAAYVNGKFNEDKTYYTDDKSDAEATLKHMTSPTFPSILRSAEDMRRKLPNNGQ